VISTSWQLDGEGVCQMHRKVATIDA